MGSRSGRQVGSLDFSERAEPHSGHDASCESDAMTPGEFIAKWRASELKERSAAQEHFIMHSLITSEENKSHVRRSATVSIHEMHWPACA